MNRHVTGSFVLILVITSTTAALPLALDAAGTAPETLPGPRHGTCTASDGHYVYVFGGQSSPGSSRVEVFRHDPATHDVTQANPNLLTARHMCAAGWYNGSAYIFSGYDYRNRGEIYRWTPGENVVKTGQLIAAASHQAAVVDAVTGTAYVFGGYANGTILQRTQAVDLRGGNSTPVISVTPFPPRAGAAAIWDPRPLPGCATGCAYIIGGDTGTGLSDSVLRFDAMTGTVSETAAHLPSGRLRHAAVFDGALIYAFGGDTAEGRTNETIRIEPNTGLTRHGSPLPVPISHVSAALVGTRASIYGGSVTGSTSFEKGILWYSPLPMP